MPRRTTRADALPQEHTFEIAYKALTSAHNFYVVRAAVAPPTAETTAPTPPGEAPRPPRQAEPESGSWFSWARGKTEQAAGAVVAAATSPDVEVECTLEGLDGKVCARAKATWPAAGVSHLLGSS